MKVHPQVLEDTGPWPRTSQELEEVTAKLLHEIEQDRVYRESWLTRQRHFYQRRFCRLFRNVSFPWRGAANVVMPTIDMTIDRLKAVLFRLIFTNPMATFVPMNSRSYPTARNADIEFHWLLGEGMPDFKKQMSIALDSMLQYGHSIMKVHWDYRTNTTKDIILEKRIVEEAERIFRDSFEDLALRRGSEPSQQESTDLRREVFEILGLGGAVDGRAETLESRSDFVKNRISNWWNLDPDETKDRDAINRIFEFLKKIPSRRDLFGKAPFEKVIYRKKDVIANAPRAAALDAESFIVPRGTRNHQDASRVTQEFCVTESQFMSMAGDLGWNSDAVNYVLEKRSSPESRSRSSSRYGRSRDSLDDIRSEREGLQSAEGDDKITLYETWWMQDIDGDGRDERVFMHFHPDTKTPLKQPRENPFNHGLYPFVKIDFELNDERFYSSRGVPEKITDIDIEITRRHRNKLNYMDMMVPTFKYKFGSNVNPSNMQFRPGAAFPVQSMDDFDSIVIPDRTISDEREENILLSWNQNIVGGFDVTLAKAANISEARTATEIQATTRSASDVLGFRGSIVQLGMKELYEMIWSVWDQWGPQDVRLRVVGTRAIRLTPEQIRGSYSIAPVGTITTTDPNAESAKKLQRLNVLLTINERFGEFALGLENELDIAQAIMLWLNSENAMDAQRIIRRRSPEEIQQITERQQRLTALANAAQQNAPMSTEELQEVIQMQAGAAPHGLRQRVTPRQGNGNAASR